MFGVSWLHLHTGELSSLELCVFSQLEYVFICIAMALGKLLFSIIRLRLRVVLFESLGAATWEMGTKGIWQ